MSLPFLVISGKRNQFHFLFAFFYFFVGTFIVIDDSFVLINRLFLVVIVCRFLMSDSTSGEGVIKAIIFCLLFAFPVLYFDFFAGYSYYKYLAISIFFLDLLLFADSQLYSKTEKVFNVGFLSIRRFSFLYFYLNFFLFLSLLVGSFDGLGDFRRVFQFGFFSISLFFLESIALQFPKSKVFLSFASYFIYVLLFSIFLWSGYGRILLGTYILIPLVLLILIGVLRINLYFIFLVAPLLLTIAQVSRHGDLSGFQDLVQGSSSSHLVFASRFYRDSTSDYFGGVVPWLEQLSLLFLNWFPSSLWDGKPVGLGSLAVDQWQGRIGVSDKYTLSPGLIGEQIYFLGDFFAFGLFGSILSLILIRFLVILFFGNYVVFRAIFYAMLFSLMWGGSATFGSRYWYYIIPLGLFLVIFNLRRKLNFRL